MLPGAHGRENGKKHHFFGRGVKCQGFVVGNYNGAEKDAEQKPMMLKPSARQQKLGSQIDGGHERKRRRERKEPSMFLCGGVETYKGPEVWRPSLHNFFTMFSVSSRMRVVDDGTSQTDSSEHARHPVRHFFHLCQQQV